MKSYEDIKRPIEICLEIVGESDSGLAFLVTDHIINPVWIPKSQIYLLKDGTIGDTIDIAMPEWLAKEKQFI